MDPTQVKSTAERLTKASEETPGERALRSQEKFAVVEHDLPTLTSRHDHAFLDGLTSYLGKFNPFAKPADSPTDLVWIFDSAAYRGVGSHWHTKCIAAFFVRHSGSEISEAAAKVASLLGLVDNQEAVETIKERLTRFANVILPARTVEVSIGGQQLKLDASGPNGISTTTVALPETAAAGDVLDVKVASGAHALAGQTRCVEQDGWAVISDVDDTIKRTLTMDPLGILRTTFVDEPQAIEGMPQLYEHMRQKLNNPAFWYLSASPYNLYPFLREFRDSFKFPAGPMILRDASWMDLGGLLTNLTQGTQAYKVDRMKKDIFAHWPRRKFICLGDSTQTDPEAYGEMYRNHPDWIKAIFIRRVIDVTELTDIAPGDQRKERNEPERFEKAFREVPREVWTVFDDPAELYGKVEEAVKRAA